MATSDNDQQPQDITFYPAFCFNASPTHFAWVKMAAVDVHRLKRRPGFGDQGLFFYLNHPIRFVSLVGIILARTEVPRRTILTLDDSSGATIDIVVLKSAPTGPMDHTTTKPPADPDIGGTNIADGYPKTATPTETHVTATNQTELDISTLVPGAVVQIKGTLSVFRSTMQVQLERFFAVRETNAEMRFLDQRSRFLVEVLVVPWCLSREEVEELRVRADEDGRRVEEEQERSRRRQRRRGEREERDWRRIVKKWEAEELVRNKEAEVCREAGVKLMREVGWRKEGLGGSG